MRIPAIVSLLSCITAFILAFLCLYAGYKPGFMESPNYAIVSLNTSRIGEHIVQKVQDTYTNDKSKLLSIFNTLLKEAFDFQNSSSSRRVKRDDILTFLQERQEVEKRGLWDDITGKITGTLSDVSGAFKALTDPNVAFEKAKAIINSFAEQIGLEDFYSYHVKDYCEGQYEPIETPNATVPMDRISSNVTGCKGYLDWRPSQPVQKLLDRTGLTRAGVSLQTIGWPEELDEKIGMAERLLDATMWLYVVTIILAGLAGVFALVVVIQPSTRKVLTGSLLSFFAIVGFVVVLVASAVTTTAAVQVAKVVNDKASFVGVKATRGNSFMGMTWACTGCLLLAGIMGVFSCCGGRRERKRIGEKYG